MVATFPGPVSFLPSLLSLFLVAGPHLSGVRRFRFLRKLPTMSDTWDSIVENYESRVEPFTRSFLEEMLQPLVDGSCETTPHLLDVGCGTGAAALYAREKGFKVTATDVSAAMVQRLRQRHKEIFHDKENNMLEVVVSDGQELPKSWSDRFDFAVGAFSVIFFPSVSRGLEEIYRCLLPGSGKMVLSAWGNAEETPAFRVFPDAVKAVAPRLLEGSKPKRIVGSPDVLKELLEKAGFENVKVIGPVKRILRVSSAEAYYDRFALGSPNTISTLSKMNEDEARQLKAKVLELVEKRGGGRSDGSIEIPSMAYFAYGTKPLRV